MPIEIKEVITDGDIKKFVYFPYQLYKGSKFWVPPMISDEIASLKASKNPAFEYCKAKFWIAVKDQQVVGRIGAIINTKFNQKIQDKFGRFTRIEFIDDENVVKKLLETAENWIVSQGMNKVHGPLGFSNLDHQGILIEGFEYLPSIASEYHFPYYQKHIENCGYEKEIDWLEFRLTIKNIPEKALRLNEVIKERYKLKVVHFTKNSEMLKYGEKVFQLINQSFDDIFGMVELSPRMRDFYINKYLKVLNPKYVKIVENENQEVLGFIIGMPSLSEAFQKARGRLLPLGWWYILKAMKKNTVADLLLTGVHPDYQRQGIPAVLITELQKVLLENGIKFVETTAMVETNHKAIQTWKNYEHIQHKRKRCFIKHL